MTLIDEVLDKNPMALLCAFLAIIVSFIVLRAWRSDHESTSRDVPMWVVSPLIRSEWLSHELGLRDGVHLKMESLQPAGSFKIRGISSFIQRTRRLKEGVDTFVTTSSANAGMAVAYAARALHCECRVILDESQRDNELLDALRTYYGAVVEFKGSSWNEADEFAQSLCRTTERMQYVPMFDHPFIFSGHSSIVREVAEQMPARPDCIVCAVGGGGLLMGVLMGLYQVGWTATTKVVAAQSAHCALLDAAIQNGYRPKATRCISADGVDLGDRSLAEAVAKMARKFQNFNPIESMLVEDEHVLNTATLFGLREKVLIEPLCAVAVAAVLGNKDYFKQFESVVVIVCGGNHLFFDRERLAKSASA